MLVGLGDSSKDNKMDVRQLIEGAIAHHRRTSHTLARLYIVSADLKLLQCTEEQTSRPEGRGVRVRSVAWVNQAEVGRRGTPL